ncbi:MAG TPA: nitroreductase family deazaflavin-dependent oxidoreductase [Streptosporangiales bacterium]
MLFGKEHVERYLATDGAEGHDWRGTSTLILTTTGRRTGQPRDSALIYGRDGDAYLVVASKGGADDHPFWYLNLVDNPTVLVQVKGERFTAKARTASPEEKARLWPIMTKEWPAYDEYQEKTDRDIPVVVLERV